MLGFFVIIPFKMCYQSSVPGKKLFVGSALFAGLALLWADQKASTVSTPITLKYPATFKEPTLPADNALTKERADLGEKLFHDTILSIDGTVSCAACHVEEFAFSDDVDLSRGFEGRLGKRNSPPLFNLAWKEHFFWDGRAKTVREQVLQPIQDHLEMAANLRRVIDRLNRRKAYRDDFEKAYGPGPITSKTLALALENYLLTIVSGNSKYDQFLAGEARLTPEEEAGRQLFFTPPQKGGAGCFECHSGPQFSDFEYRNNGLPVVHDLQDLGRFQVTGQKSDRLLFATPSLRNIEITSPYMHDGRFAKLEQAVAHYAGPLHGSPTLDSKLKPEGLDLDAKKQAALVAFLKTLTDPRFIEEEE